MLTKHCSVSRLLPKLSQNNQRKSAFFRFQNTDQFGLLQSVFMSSNYADFLCGRSWEYSSFGSRFFESPEKFEGVEFSLISYNILAQQLLESNKAELYSNVSGKSLSWFNRRYRLLLELRFYNPHVVCLQEVQSDHYEADLKDVFESMGYSCVYQKRTGDKSDGCLIMYHKNSFKLIKQKKVEFFRNGVDNLNRDNVGVIVILSPTGQPDLKVCIATTHLLFNPKRGEIKLSQMALLFAEANKLMQDVQEQGHQKKGAFYRNIPFILCGDFNITPFSPFYNFLKDGYIDYTNFTGSQIAGVEKYKHGRFLEEPLLPDNVGIGSNCKFVNVSSGDTFNRSRYSFMGSRLSHNHKFASVYSHRSLRFPDSAEVTSFHDKCCQTLDYILYSRGQKGAQLQALCRLGLLTGGEIYSKGGLPNLLQPSDHLPLMASFLLSKTENKD